MSMKKKNKFNVIIDDWNSKEFKAYDVMEYLESCYKREKAKDRPKTFDEFKEFVTRKSMYMYFARCEYEIVLKAWCSRSKEKKIDVYWQIKNNIDLVTRLLMENVGVLK